MLILVPAAEFSIPLRASGGAVEDGPGAWVTAALTGTLEDAPGVGLAESWTL